MIIKENAMFAEEKKYFQKMCNRNKHILNSRTRDIRNNRVNLHWWSREDRQHVENVGDYLSVVVCEYMLAQKGLSFDTPVSTTKHLYGIGSIIQGGAQNATIWGSGLKNGVEDIGFLFKHTRKLDIRLVRGPRTREALMRQGFRCPEKYGDPALIMPLIYAPEGGKTGEPLVVLHHASQIQCENSITPLYTDYKEFINRIASSSLVISSSLHGIILAEAYDVPAVLLDDDAVKNKFKYEDYYYSTGRHEFPMVRSVEEGMRVSPPSIPDLKKIRQDIISTFPYDLWE